MGDFVGDGDEVGTPRPALPDLGTQLEDIVTHVLDCEAWQRVEDRIDLAVKILRQDR
jgi:hypothetical protein